MKTFFMALDVITLVVAFFVGYALLNWWLDETGVPQVLQFALFFTYGYLASGAAFDYYFSKPGRAHARRSGN